jgi:hypothetical protein
MRRLIPAVLILVAAVFSTSAPAAAASDCERVSLSGQTQLNFANGRIEGVLTGTAGRDPISIFSSTAVLEQQERGSATFIKTTHAFTVVDGEHEGAQLTTLDNGVLVQSRTPGVSHAVNHLRIVSGGSGFLVAVGSLDFRTGVTATWRHMVGRICGL